MKKVSLFQSPLYEDRNYNRKVFVHSSTRKVEASMMFSRIECQAKQKVGEGKYILHKIARANRHKIAEYQQRKRNAHPNLLAVDVDQTSSFYVTIKVEKGEIFSLKHLLIQQIDRRSEMLKNILITAKFLSKLYGFFYITEKMLLYRNTGTLTLWINQNILENYSSFPINHSKMSQQFFISDFKANFIGNLRQAKALRKAKTIDNILSILHQQNKIFHSIYMSEPADRMSQIYRRNSIETNSNISCKNVGLRYNQRKYFGSNIFSNDLSNMKKSISFSYLPSQIESRRDKNKNSLVKTLANSISAQNLRERRQSNSTLKLITNSITLSSIINLTSSSKNIRSSNLPIINFSYSKQHNIEERWKKKKENLVNKQSSYFSNFISKSQSMAVIAPIFQRNNDNQPLKVSFPSTISQSFIPYTQSEKNPLKNENQFNQEKKKASETNEMNIFHRASRQQLKKQEASQLQMDLQVLFSDSEDQMYSREHMDIIIEEFQNILLS